MPAEVKVAIIAPTPDTRDMLRAQVQASGLASVEMEADQYCVGFADRVTRRLIEVRPDVVVVDMQEADAALHTLRILHTGLPAAWLFVTSAANDAQLVIEAMRAGAREYLVRPVSGRVLSQALGRFLSARERNQRQKDLGHLYCVVAAKGGAGATSVAVNMAAAVAASPEARAALVDLNAPTGDAAGYLELTPQYTLGDVLAAAGRLDGVLLKSLMVNRGALSVVCGPREPWSETGASPATLGRVIEVLLEEATHAFADVPASLDSALLRTVTEASSAVLVVLTSELPALWRTQRLLATLDRLGCGEKVRLILNRSRRGEEVSGSEIEKTLGRAIFCRLPNNYPAAIRAIDSGTPVASGGSDLGRAFGLLTRRVTGLQLPERRHGLFGSLRSFSTRPSNA